MKIGSFISAGHSGYSVKIAILFLQGNFKNVPAGKMEKYGLGGNPVRCITIWLQSSHNRKLVDRNFRLCSTGPQYKLWFDKHLSNY